MPVYEYACDFCGGFDAFAPVAAFDLPQPCPGCRALAPRVLVAMPRLARMPGNRLAAHERNEQSASEPDLSRRSGRHPPGCGCCRTAPANKSFPGRRPWMVSH